MKIYFAGVPGGDQEVREREMKSLCVSKRLISFFYEEQGLITIKEFHEGFFFKEGSTPNQEG